VNALIINNLYELWDQIGNMTNKLFKMQNYTVVSMGDSDWPNRIYNLKDDTESLTEILQLSRQNKLPEFIAIPKPNNLERNTNLEFVTQQKNMALGLELISNKTIINPNIIQVKTEKEAIYFADTASKSFGYKVDSQVVYSIVQNSETIRLFIFIENNVSLGCGLVFFDSNNNAGLHMIGTLPEGRGKGIGRSITEKLLIEAKEQGANYCVLHASVMGESIYKKLGFKPYGELATYKILNE
jgi:ribosomal protein S18 acetylase RimI-like enzyme